MAMVLCCIDVACMLRWRALVKVGVGDAPTRPTPTTRCRTDRPFCPKILNYF